MITINLIKTFQKYNILKENYPFLRIVGVVSQFHEYDSSSYGPALLSHELGYYTDTVYDLYDYTDIYDNDDQDGVNPFYKAADNTEKYEKFNVKIKLSDYYDFSIGDYDIGNAYIDNGYLYWNLDNKYVAGNDAFLNLYATIKNEYVRPDKYYQISNGTDVIVKAYKFDEKLTHTNNTTVYKSLYNINYNINCPDKCNIDNNITVNVRPFTKVFPYNIKVTSEEFNFEVGLLLMNLRFIHLMLILMLCGLNLV